MNPMPFLTKHALSLILAALVCSTFALPAAAEAHDPSWGASLHAQHCAACHAAPHDAAFYESRRGGKIQNFESLQTKVQSCANHFNLPWFDEEVSAVSTYLNQNYYQFE
ncbi:cytochrome c [Halothiobacillus sp.]|uniref:cytochrome c n=1 Tax=Halothiobacillus sp. TaxID=1891311 RepID=UPI00260BC179|nr:cytochrome c [Halothiobacillus sp.]